MKLDDVPFGATDWRKLETSTHPGETGSATARTRQWGDVQVRLVDYSPNYPADHWCDKGHILLVIAGSLVIEHQGGRKFALSSGMSWHVADGGGPPHRVLCQKGATVFIVD
jgi:hypothetical protein